MILSDGTLHERLDDIILTDADATLVNPASIDIRVGRYILLEVDAGRFLEFDLMAGDVPMMPGAFALVPTFESIAVPNGYAMDLRLKSSRAREGWDHSLAFWVDPGWRGNLTMEIRNGTRYTPLSLRYRMRFAQVIIHSLDALAVKPYQGRYQDATGVEKSKG